MLSLRDKLRQTKKIKVEGVLFEIRKISPLDFLAGFKVMQEFYMTYDSLKVSNPSEKDRVIKKVKDHYRDVFMAGVTKPELSRKQDDGTKVWVDEIFADWDMTLKLYDEIIEFTYGKKKLKQLGYLEGTSLS